MSDNTPRLLIVDDQPDSVALLLSYLGDQELDIRVALDGEDALVKAQSGQPNLVLLDVVMPGLDGFEVCRRLKDDPRTADIPVIFLSASNAIADKLKGFTVGGVDYVTKPFSEAEVLARVSVHLHSKQRLARLESMAANRVLETVADLTGRDDRIFQDAVRMLESRLADPPTLTGLTQALGTNERKLTELFRRRVGLTVFDYFGEMRLETGRRLLEGSDIRIQLIADRVGYRNAGDFTRAFRRRYGVTPREYRQARGGSEDDEA